MVWSLAHILTLKFIIQISTSILYFTHL